MKAAWTISSPSSTPCARNSPSRPNWPRAKPAPPPASSLSTKLWAAAGKSSQRLLGPRRSIKAWVERGDALHPRTRLPPGQGCPPLVRCERDYRFLLTELHTCASVGNGWMRRSRDKRRLRLPGVRWVADNRTANFIRFAEKRWCSKLNYRFNQGLTHRSRDDGSNVHGPKGANNENECISRINIQN